jgi:hypothetical protein
MASRRALIAGTTSVFAELDSSGDMLEVTAGGLVSSSTSNLTLSAGGSYVVVDGAKTLDAASIDRQSAAGVSIGGTNANAVSLGRSGVTTSILGPTTLYGDVAFDPSIGTKVYITAPQATGAGVNGIDIQISGAKGADDATTPGQGGDTWMWGGVGGDATGSTQAAIGGSAQVKAGAGGDNPDTGDGGPGGTLWLAGGPGTTPTGSGAQGVGGNCQIRGGTGIINGLVVIGQAQTSQIKMGATGIPTTFIGEAQLETDALLRLAERASAPTPVADKGFLYSKDIGGVTELFYHDYLAAGSHEVQITTNGAVNASSVAGGGWTPTGTVVHLTTSGDTVAVGTSTMSASEKLRVAGSALFEVADNDGLAFEVVQGSDDYILVDTTDNSEQLILGNTTVSNLLVALVGNEVAIGAPGNPTDVTITIDDDSTPFTIKEGTNEYFNIVTTNGSESITLGNATTNPSVAIGSASGVIALNGKLTTDIVFDESNLVAFISSEDRTVTGGTGRTLGIQAGNGGTAGGGSGGTGGNASLLGGNGGTGIFSDAAGNGGVVTVQGGSGGANAGAGGGAGGAVRVRGGGGTGTEDDGFVYIGDANTGAIILGDTSKSGQAIQIAGPSSRIVFVTTEGGDHAISISRSTTAGITGDSQGISAGGGGNGTTGTDGGVGGNCAVSGGGGGAGTATDAAGAGGIGRLTGGAGGINNGGGGGIGGNVELRGGSGSGAEIDGKVLVGPSNTSAIEVGNATDDPTWQYLSAGKFEVGNGTTSQPLVEFSVADDASSAWWVYEGDTTRSYIRVRTSNGAESVFVGNTTNNPTFEQLGTGNVTFGGNVNANSGVDIDGSLTLVEAAGNTAVIDMTDGESAAAAISGHGRIRFNETEGYFEYSEDGNAWAQAFGVSSGGYWSQAGGAVYPTTGTDDVVIGGTATVGTEKLRVVGNILLEGDLLFPAQATNIIVAQSAVAGGSGSQIVEQAGHGGTNAAGTGGSGGPMFFDAGAGGAASGAGNAGGYGGAAYWRGGAGGATTGTGAGGEGGAVLIQGGVGGVSTGGGANGDGGDVTIQGGAVGAGATAGSVSIGASNTSLVLIGSLTAPTSVIGEIRLSNTSNLANIDLTAGESSAVSAADHGRLRYNKTTDKLEKSENGGAYSPINAPDVTVASATATTTTTSAVATQMDSMTLTPVAGTYLVWFSSSLRHSTNAASIFTTIDAGGSIVQASSMTFVRGLAQGDVGSSFTCQAVVTVNGAQAIRGLWRTDAATATALERQLIIMRVA